MDKGSAPPPQYATGYTVSESPMQHPQQNFTTQQAAYDQQTSAAPTGSWKDDIFSCFTNLWPSCGCTLVFFGGWIMGQIAHKTNYMEFNSWMLPFLSCFIICWFISIFVRLIWLIPMIIALVFGCMLRVHVMKTYNIQGNGTVLEVLTHLFCCWCSVAQMARHVYGYTKVLDGDSNPDVEDYYSRAQAVPTVNANYQQHNVV